MKKYVVTRPRLAGRLIRAGQQAFETVNPFKPEFRAWEFELNEYAVKIIRNYYESINQPVPRVIENWEKSNECV